MPAVAASDQSQVSALETRRYYDQLVTSLENDRATWEPHWRDLSDYILPRRSRWQATDRNRGNSRKNDKIIDSTGTQSARTLAAGMMSGLTSPSRPWFKLTVPDQGLAEVHSVKSWLEDVEKLMREVFVKSNLYTSLSTCYLDLGVFGGHAMVALEDDEDTVRFYPLPIGSYWLGSSYRQQIDTLVRKWSMTAQQMVDEFGIENVSSTVRDAVENRNGHQWYDVMHVICPNKSYKRGMIGPEGFKFSSDYFEVGTREDQRGAFLRRSGFNTFPVLAPRWATVGEDAYGYGPAMDALGDIKGLQLMQRNKAKAIAKEIDPPLKGPGILRQQGVSLIPGAITFMDGPVDGLSPIHQVKLNVRDLVEDIREHQHRVRSCMYHDLFLMLQQSDRRDITATEIQAREQERMLQLGPVLERLNDELLDPLIDRTFEIMWRKGKIPPPPPELEGMELKVEYVSIMAQAQRMLGITAVDRAMGFVGNLSAVAPDAVDKIDTDAAIEEYFDMLGVSPKVMRHEDEVMQIRQARAEAQQAQQQAEIARDQAQAANILSKTDARGDNALGDMVRAQTGR